MQAEVIDIDPVLKKEVDRRRTFAIVSHPDAGKTTLTEKILLLGGAIRMAGDVKARKTNRYARSDWMAVEQERGISVTSSVMKINYGGYEINLLDTPGHQDFSEDTYRVLTAVDSAVVIIDGAKGVEEQTVKLMDVCRMRHTPIITFVNKMDRQGMDPLDVLHNIEEHLKITCAPLSWPIGMGADFKGVYDLYARKLRLFSVAGGGTEEVIIEDLDDPRLDRLVGSAHADQLRFDVPLIAEAGETFDVDAYLAGEQTPVFFGSALNDFGVQEMLDTFVEIAPPPRERETTSRPVSPYESDFSGVVFKIQANMDPAHRDRIAFMRICSGKFERGMKVQHHRIGKEVKISNATIFMAQDRAGVEEAFPGDIIGIHNHGTVKIGDTFTAREPLKFTGIPSFAPEHFRKVRLDDPLRAKQLLKGVTQLAEEGTIQLFRMVGSQDLILGAVGVLQFDVTVARLRDEYNVNASLVPTQFGAARWVESDDTAALKRFVARYEAQMATDPDDTYVFMAENDWWLHRVMQEWKEIQFFKAREHV